MLTQGTTTEKKLHKLPLLSATGKLRRQFAQVQQNLLIEMQKKKNLSSMFFFSFLFFYNNCVLTYLLCSTYVLLGMHTWTPKPFQCPEAGELCNPCLDATKACNLNGLCKKHRSNFIATCRREETNKGETCNKKRCHKTLRAFMDRVPPGLSHRLIFCPCQSEGCAERRRQTIVPDCSYTDEEQPNCLELRQICRADPLCR